MEFKNFINKLENLQTEEIEIQTVIYSITSVYVEIHSMTCDREVCFEIGADYAKILESVKSCIDSIQGEQELNKFLTTNNIFFSVPDGLKF